VQVVPDEAHAHAVAGAEQLLDVGSSRPFRVPQQPEIGGVGKVDIAVPRQHSRRDAIGDSVEAVRKHRRLIHLPVAVTVPDQPQAIRILRVIGDALAFVFGHVGDAFLNRLDGQFLIEPVHVVADVRHARVQAEGLDHEEPSVFIDGKGHGIGEKRFRGRQLHLQTRRKPKPFHGQLTLVGRRLNRGRIARFIGAGFGRAGSRHHDSPQHNESGGQQRNNGGSQHDGRRG
jgi:hypothetical protein